MLIGINARIGSGKDTVAKMIQRIDLIKRVEAGVLSHSIVPSLKDLDESTMYASSWQIKKFAGSLKIIASMLTGIPVEKFENQEFKKTMLGEEWGMTVRELLQKLGTEAIRNGLHTNSWVNCLMSTYKPVREKVADEEYKK